MRLRASSRLHRLRALSTLRLTKVVDQGRFRERLLAQFAKATGNLRVSGTADSLDRIDLTTQSTEESIPVELTGMGIAYQGTSVANLMAERPGVLRRRLRSIIRDGFTGTSCQGPSRVAQGSMVNLRVTGVPNMSSLGARR